MQLKAAIRMHGCWVHARRKFEKALDYDQARVSHVITQIQRVYTIERTIRGRPAGVRMQVRQQGDSTDPGGAPDLSGRQL